MVVSKPQTAAGAPSVLTGGLLAAVQFLAPLIVAVVTAISEAAFRSEAKVFLDRRTRLARNSIQLCSGGG